MTDLASLSAALAEAEENITLIEKRATDAEARVTELEGELEGVKADLAKAKPALSEDEQEAELLKGLPPAFRAKLEADREELRKSREREDEMVGLAKARAVGATEAQAKTLGPVLQRIAKGRSTAEDAEVIEGLLKSANAQVSASGLFGRLGSGSKVEGDPEATIDARAEEIRKAKPHLTKEAAWVEAFEEQGAASHEAILEKSRHRSGADE